MDLQQQAVALIEQLSVEKLKFAVDYLTYLQDRDARNGSLDHEVPPRGLGTSNPRDFQTFRGDRT